jgi:hypothetical protein
MTTPDEKDKVWEQRVTQLLRRVDVARTTRAQWRTVCTATERPSMQDLVIRLAEAAEAYSHAQRLALYKAAHAILPLHGRALIAFAGLLVEEQPPQAEWADALLAILIEAPTLQPQLIPSTLTALHSIWRESTGDDVKGRRARWIAYHIQQLGYRPDWLPNTPIPALTLFPEPAGKQSPPPPSEEDAG